MHRVQRPTTLLKLIENFVASRCFETEKNRKEPATTIYTNSLKRSSVRYFAMKETTSTSSLCVVPEICYLLSDYCSTLGYCSLGDRA